MTWDDMICFEREGKVCMETLKDVAAEKRRDLEQITGELKLAQSQIQELYKTQLNYYGHNINHWVILTSNSVRYILSVCEIDSFWRY